MRTAINIMICAALFGFGIGACSGDSDKTAGDDNMQGMAQGDHSAHKEMKMGSGEPTSESIYNVDSRWLTRHGNSVKLDSLRGKVQVVAMVYTSCEYACPRILSDMQRVQDGLTDKARTRTNFMIISIDPKRDTPERFREFAAENNLSDEHWTLLHGDQGDILEVAALLGVKYKRISETDFSHSNMITVLNQEGEIVHQRQKLADNQEQTIQQVEQLVD